MRWRSALPAERRAVPRYRLDCPALLLSPQDRQCHVGRLVELSTAAMVITTDTQMRAGDQVVAWVDLPSGCAACVASVVRYRGGGEIVLTPVTPPASFTAQIAAECDRLAGSIVPELPQSA